MSATEIFFDTNILLYLLSADADRADRAEVLIGEGGVISVQVLNEFASVASRKLGMAWAEIRDVLETIRTLCRVEPVTVDAHEHALHLAERYGLSFYDAVIVASALLAGCQTLYTEDMQNGQRIEGRLLLRDPFRR